MTERIERGSMAVPERPSLFEAQLRVQFEPGAREVCHQIPVPAGRQLVIECVRARLQGGLSFAPRGRVMLVLQTQTLSRSSVHLFRFAPPEVDSSRPDSNVFQKTHLTADPDSRIELVFIRESDEDARGVVVSVLGTLSVQWPGLQR